MNVTYAITFSLKAGAQTDFLNLLNPVLDAMRHEETFVNAILHRDAETPGHFMLYETWTDEEDVANVQIHRDYRQEFWTRLPDLLAAPRDVQTWRPMRADGKVGAAAIKAM